MQVEIQALQKDLTSDKGAMSTNLTSFHQYDDKVRCVRFCSRDDSTYVDWCAVPPMQELL